MKMAKEKGLTGKSYVWIATQSVIGETREALPDFPAGMLGNYILHEFYILTSFIFFCPSKSDDLNNGFDQLLMPTALYLYLKYPKRFTMN